MAGGAEEDEYTYDLALVDGGPRRPDLADLGGEDFADNASSAPQKGIDPYAGYYNEHARNLAGLNRLTPTARVWIEWDSGDSEWIIVGAEGMGSTIDDTSFTLTPVSAGIVTVSWDAGTLPAMERKPLVRLTDDFGVAFAIVMDPNSVRVRTANLSAVPPVAESLHFVLEIH